MNSKEIAAWFKRQRTARRKRGNDLHTTLVANGFDLRRLDMLDPLSPVAVFPMAHTAQRYKVDQNVAIPDSAEFANSYIHEGVPSLDKIIQTLMEYVKHGTK